MFVTSFAHHVATSAASKLEQWEPTPTSRLQATALFIVANQILALLGIVYNSLGLVGRIILPLSETPNPHLGQLAHSFRSSMTGPLSALRSGGKVDSLRFNTASIFGASLVTKSPSKLALLAKTLANHRRKIVATVLVLSGFAAYWAIPEGTFPAYWQRISNQATESIDKAKRAAFRSVGLEHLAIPDELFSPEEEARIAAELELSIKNEPMGSLVTRFVGVGSIRFVGRLFDLGDLRQNAIKSLAKKDAIAKIAEDTWKNAISACESVGGAYEGVVNERFTCVVADNKISTSFFGGLDRSSYCFGGDGDTCLLAGFNSWLNKVDRYLSISWYSCPKNQTLYHRYAWWKYPHMNQPRDNNFQFCSRPRDLAWDTSFFRDQSDKNPTFAFLNSL